MTATSVNGISVLQDRPTKTPITKRGTNEPIYWEQVRELTLANGSVVYGCLHCDRTYPNWKSVRPHLNAHRAPKPRVAPSASLVQAQEQTIAILGQELDRAERRAAKLAAGEKAAKAEARRLKRELDTLRGILNPSLAG